jgi:polyisoprenoid-binding protein YceI
MKIFNFFLLVSIFFFSSSLFSKDIWILDKNLSSINFEIPVLLLDNVKGEFKTIEGLVKIDIENKENNKAIFSVEIDSLNMNYVKYKDLLLSSIFFDSLNYPIALLDTKKFLYKNEKILNLYVDLTIKGVTNNIPIEIEINHLAEELIQVKSKMKFSRKSFKIGSGKWSSTKILNDKVTIKTNLFLFRK